ncbi:MULTISPECIES: dethiobiotin synthase [unclassified Brucella]|uniref:dethiobiotin synthase n=1 Tax=unclassified Brucella TaxID=2632610 RepID=UPI000D032EE8|nr:MULTISPECIES: dethiobiotin synthase [unclassified Brucella]
MNSRLIVTGTDTGIGKTVFSAALCHALGAAYWKPVQSGLEEETDGEIVARLAQASPQRILPEAWRLNTPASPHLSARLDGVEIRPEEMHIPATSLPLVIEGAGGLLVPLNDKTLFADLFAIWRIPAILCARAALGTINHTLLSLEAMRSRDIPVLGVAFIGEANEDTETTIAHLGRVKRLGRLPLLDDLSPEKLHHSFARNFHIDDFAGVAR